MTSRFLTEGRDVIVLLPPDYNIEPSRRYPVLYLQDGQNLFDADTAFANQEWGVDESIADLLSEGSIEPLIVIGIYNSGVGRLDDYTAVRDRRHGGGGGADRYARFLVEELVPFIDAEYRTLRGAAGRGLGGSSLGGLVTLYVGFRHPETFGKLMVMSPSVWWAQRAILRQVRRLIEQSPRPRVWLDVGTDEGSTPSSCLRDVRDLRDVLLNAGGWKDGENFAYNEDLGAGHNEYAWGIRIRGALRFLFPAAAAVSCSQDASIVESVEPRQSADRLL